MTTQQWLPFAIIPVVLIMVLLKNRNKRLLKPQYLWVMPAIVVPMIGMGLYFTPHAAFGPGAWAGFGLALVLGSVTGWWRAKTITIEKEPDGRLMAQASPLGLVLLVVLFAARSGLRSLMEANAAQWHLNAAAVTDAFMVFAVGLIVAQRVEMYIRAKRVQAGGMDTHVEVVA